MPNLLFQFQTALGSVATSMTGKGGKVFFLFIRLFSPKGEWADPGGTAIPGQPVAKAEQAPDTSPRFKNQFNIEAPI